MVMWVDTGEPLSWWIWKLIPVKVEGVSAPSQTSSYDNLATGESSTHIQPAESEHDEFGTVVTEVTIVTTRKRYRVEGA